MVNRLLRYVHWLSTKRVIIFLSLFSIIFVYWFLSLGIEIKLNIFVLTISEIFIILIASIKIFYPKLEVRSLNVRKSKLTAIFLILLINLSFISIEMIFFIKQIASLMDSVLHKAELTSAVIVILNAIIIVTITYAILKMEGFTLKDLDISRKKFIKGYKWTFSFFIVILLFELIVNLIENNEISFNIDRTILLNALNLIKFVFFVGISEEIIFRSFLFNQLRLKLNNMRINKKLGLALALTISSIFFSLFHVPSLLGKDVPGILVLYILVGNFLAGAIFSILYLVTGNIFLVSGMHGLLDFDHSNYVLYLFIMLIIILFKKR